VDGYPLPAESNYRCPECGRACQREILESWFDGIEQRRTERGLWLCGVALVMHAWMIPDLFGFPWTGFLWIGAVGLGASGGWACLTHRMAGLSVKRGR
jgi:hypothetical protein